MISAEFARRKLCRPRRGACTVAQWFVANEDELASALAGAKLRACDRCHRLGTLVGHGRLLGYAESSSERVVRGHRLLCSNRHRRDGCGRTVTVWHAAVVPRRIVRAATIFAFFSAIAAGSSTATAWRQVSAMTLRTGYRIRSRLLRASPAIRTALLSRAPPPFVDSLSPDAQLLAHLRASLGTSFDAFAVYQRTFQRPLFA